LDGYTEEKEIFKSFCINQIKRVYAAAAADAAADAAAAAREEQKQELIRLFG
jgi:hypothetical protein